MYHEFLPKKTVLAMRMNTTFVYAFMKIFTTLHHPFTKMNATKNFNHMIFVVGVNSGMVELAATEFRSQSMAKILTLENFRLHSIETG